MNKFALLLALLLTGCSLAPNFKLPEFKLPTAYKEAPAAADPARGEQWAAAVPLEKSERGQWWKIFGDAQLNALEEDAAKANPSLQAASARVEQARAAVRAEASAFLPQIDLGGNAMRAQTSTAGAAAFGNTTGLNLKPYNVYSARANVSYEVDLFGRVRDTEKALIADADAQEALYRSVLLALQADVAEHYLSLRALDAERALLRETIAVYQEGQRIMQRRYDLGEDSEQNLARSRAELASARAELLALDRQRAVLDHALAVLLGRMPAEFTLAEASFTGNPPQIPAGLPSSLLQRRPDVAASLAAMAAANSRIGVARTAYFPSLILTASGGAEANTLHDLFQWSSRVWALGQLGGSALSATIFDNGRTGARVDQAKAAYREALANYQAQMLTAFREVEDSLAAQRLLAEQSAKQHDAATAAARATDLTRKRYSEGDADYFEVVEAERTNLSAARADIQTSGQRFLTTVALIRALGGGWEPPAAK